MKKLMVTLFALALAWPAFADSMTGSALQSFMSNRKMSFDAGSVATFGGGAGGGKVTMKHKGSKALTGTYKVGSKSVSMKLSDGSSQTFTVEEVSKNKYLLRYTSGPYKGKKFTFR
ncbi:hypothetical protein [Rhizobium sp. L1K21]|uniref:hypothetical protein n=1 Tax=Rhizobium sp. L1K21 TaxID=2954933 RepID=UPI0020924369|nr:hypothetical protein [Rhizobium sp. L1K21]MCO6187201.1 hypothetical protein [Rhizobium sp. L1K21]